MDASRREGGQGSGSTAVLPFTSAWRLRSLGAQARADHAAAAALVPLGDEALLARAAALRAEAPRPALEARMALAIEAVRRGMGIDPHYEQVMAARGLMERCLVQVQTGEGKTVSGALAAICHALVGRRVHLVTTNDYLAGRDASVVRAAAGMLGFAVGALSEELVAEPRRAQYRAALTYTSHTQLGFDYLRDQLVSRAADRTQSPPDVVLVDEADAILIDEATTPFNIARGGVSPGPELAAVRDAVERLRATRDFEVNLDTAQASLTPEGELRLVDALVSLSLLSPGATPEALYTGSRLTRAMLAAIHAHAMLRRDEHYLVSEGGIVLIDEATGRPQPHRRLLHGIQSALECKERVRVHEETQRLASVSCPALFRRYAHLAGMTGTAAETDDELESLYGLSVLRIPPHRPSVRRDMPDEVFANDRERRAALCTEAARLHAAGIPVLVGAPSEDSAAAVAADLVSRGLSVRQLSAKDPAHEAAIVADAGREGAVTVATPIAGRGVDVRLGGVGGLDARARDVARERVIALGGLAVLGYGRRTSRRLDDQLRGRAGRQGEPGSARFFVSLDDHELRGVDDHDELVAARRGSLEGHALAATRTLVDSLQGKRARRASGQRMSAAALDGVVDELRDAVFGLRSRVLAGAPLSDAERRSARPYDEVIQQQVEAWIDEVPAVVETVFRVARVSQADLGGRFQPVLMARHMEAEFGVYVELHDLGASAEDALSRLRSEIPVRLHAQQQRALAAIVRAAERTAPAEREAANEAIRAAQHRFQGRLKNQPRRWLRFFRLVFTHHLDRLWRDGMDHAELLRDNAALAGNTQRSGLNQLRTALHELWSELGAAIDHAVMRDLLTLPRGALRELESWEQRALGTPVDVPPWR